MNKLYTKGLCAWALGLLFALQVNAQDIHYSQFNNSPLNLSPALTGAFSGDTRLGANYRSQWSNVPVGYQQATAFADMKFVKKDLEDKPFTPWSGGLLFDYDRAGDSKMNLLQIGANVSYTLGLGQKSGLIFGGAINGIQRAFDSAFLRFGDQYNGKDPLTATDETFASQSKVYGSLDGGVTYRFKALQERTTFYLGFGAFHLNQPKRNFFDEAENRLPRRMSYFGAARLQMTDNLDLFVEANHQTQGPHTETLFGVGLPIHLKNTKSQELALQPGVSWRLNDAVIPYIMLYYKQWQAGLSYDINTSRFTEATLNRGGPEFSLIYIFARPRELPYCPLCPTYL